MGYPRFGVEIPGFSPVSSNETSFVEQVMSFLRGLGSDFDSVWCMDHFYPWQTWACRTADVLECFTTISYLSGVFTKLNFGSIVLCNSYRNPALLAKMGATLDALTGGRFILGLGAGWLEDEYRSYGYGFPPSMIRIKHLEEGVQIIRKMWSEEAANFEGKYFAVTNAYCNPKPDPPPPIMIGGKGKELLRVVARYADWWNSGNCTPKEYGRRLDILKDHCDRENREFKKIPKTMVNLVAIAKSEKGAQTIVEKSQHPWDEAYFAGTPERIKDQIRAFTDIGVKHFILNFLDFPNLSGARLFVEKVMPEFLC